jgi:hypothetical protein
MSIEFKGLRVFFSVSISGVPEPDKNIIGNLADYIKINGAEILNEQVTARDPQKREEIRARIMKKNNGQLYTTHPPDNEIYRQNMEWLDQATHLVGLVNGPSLGVGMELERAISNRTPVLCLVRDDFRPRLSLMVSGAISSQSTPEEYQLRIYQTPDQAKGYIRTFLNRTSL